MSRKLNASAMDDVDRLFQCFKCGISPPPSAMRERKRIKNKSKQETPRSQVSSSLGVPSPGTGGEKQKNAIDDQLCVDTFGSMSVKTSKVSSDKQISPVVFYGSPHGVPPKRPLSLLRLLNEIRVDLSEEKKSNIRKEVWATFPRQEEAMKFAKEHAPVHVFCYQDHFNGQRRFLVSTYEEFWKRYNYMDLKHRHHYEIIQEGFPCHLYFDLEFNKKDNSEKNGDEMVDDLISVTLEALLEKYSIEGNHEWVVELDSSTKEKFSRHLIIRIPKTAFKDNLHAGAFVTEICSRIVSAKDSDTRFQKLFVQKDTISANPANQLFVDTAVYSRNRAFRLALSSKAGKTSVLVPTGRFKCKDMCEKDMFMQSLICNMESDCEKLLVCKMELDCVKTLHFGTEEQNNYGRYRSAYQDLQQNPCTNDVSTSYLMGKSPFPVLDKFIEHVASIGDVSGKVRSWYWFSEYSLIIYSMLRNRYCERIGRQHKSNHVMYVVDLRRAVYYQKCYDPDCRGYRSPMRLVPTDIIPEPSSFFDSGQIVHQGGLMNNKGQFLDSSQDFDLKCFNELDTETDSKESWWVEASKVADDVENMPKTSETIDDEDDDWWLAAETTVSQAEQNLN